MSDIATKLNTSGTIGIIPTDTVYGIVARASDQVAVTRLYNLKVREHKPGTLIAASIDQLVELGVKRRYLKAVEEYWPGPLSVVIPCGNELDYLHLGTFGLAVRLPDNKKLISLLETTGPLLTTSANPPGKPVANTIQQAKDYFKDTVDFYEDGGDLSSNLPSTIVKIVDDAVEIIRQGAVKINDQ